MALAAIPLILPAAGKSSRLGRPKGLLSFRGRPWLEGQCQVFQAAGGRDVVLVVGYDADQYLCALGLDPTRSQASRLLGGCALHIVSNLLPEFGPFSSLQRACLWVESRPAHPAAFFLPIDIPVPSAAVLQTLARAMDADARVCEPRYRGRGGHPVLLSRACLAELGALDPTAETSRLDAQIRVLRERGRVRSVAVNDPRVGLNLNTPEAWRAYVEAEGSSLHTPNANVVKLDDQ